MSTDPAESETSSDEELTGFRRHINHEALRNILNIRVVREQSPGSVVPTTQPTEFYCEYVFADGHVEAVPPPPVKTVPQKPVCLLEAEAEDSDSEKSVKNTQRPVSLLEAEAEDSESEKSEKNTQRPVSLLESEAEDSDSEESQKNTQRPVSLLEAEAEDSDSEKSEKNTQRPVSLLEAEAEDSDSEESESENAVQPFNGPIYSPFNAQVFPETAVWPTKAFIRFFQAITQTPFFTGCAYPFARRFHLQQIHQKMLSFRTDDKILPKCIVHPDDHEKLDAADGEVVYVRPVYETRPTLEEVKKQFRYFYNTDHIDKPLEGPHQQPGRFRELAKRIQPAQQPWTLSRSRRTGRPNPIIEAIIEEKKKYTRSATR